MSKLEEYEHFKNRIKCADCQAELINVEFKDSEESNTVYQVFCPKGGKSYKHNLPAKVSLCGIHDVVIEDLIEENNINIIKVERCKKEQ